MKKIHNKWGFGMAPLKDKTKKKYNNAVTSVYNLIQNEKTDENILGNISEFKGMINRCLRQDQWDWFTVYELFGEPDLRYLYPLPQALSELRNGLIEEDKEVVDDNIKFLRNSYAKKICEIFLGIEEWSVDDLGYIYILSRRNEKDVLKIGMTERNVVKRVKEINSATGILRPFSPREVFKVKNPAYAEKEIFKKLEEYRIRTDREFFNIDYYEAKRKINSLMLELRLYNKTPGTIKFINDDKGYGFIKNDKKGDIFFHFSEVKDLDSLEEGSKVDFFINYSKKGIKAEYVEIINDN
ncbi:cold shock domain-containing protein [Halanaerobacter jeridensis]|uniref:Cold shock CspA family protein n=1 Tax=Halanaerobacter jeridensis TaxID=706427 RepID=A0A938XNQ4_9FIRM|nr:cold shock domain-containing protein [Halanaerobacter jeridensis]MBM7555792.1 cold shock CspA family protein [Halanaerobacter jeridensis]